MKNRTLSLLLLLIDLTNRPFFGNSRLACIFKCFTRLRMGRGVAAGFPVFLYFPASLDRYSIVFVFAKLLDISFWSDSSEVTATFSEP